MKCVDCKQAFEYKKKKRDIKITSNNPGAIFFEGEVAECPHCGKQYADEDNFEALADIFDKACK